MKEILLLEIYTNIVTNRHGTCSYMTLYDSEASISFISILLSFLFTFVAVAFANLHLQK